MRRFVFLSLVGAAVFVVAACGPTATPTSQPSDPPSPGPTAATEVASSPGQAVYNAQGCGRCHTLGGKAASGGWGGKGPDLSKAGAKHDKTWIADHIRDAKAHNPMSRMPLYPEEKLSAKDLETLAEYLAGLK